MFINGQDAKAAQIFTLAHELVHIWIRAVLFALYELQRDVDIDEAISHLRDQAPRYLSRREDLMALVSAIASKRGSESTGRSGGGAHSLQPNQERAAGVTAAM